MILGALLAPILLAEPQLGGNFRAGTRGWWFSKGNPGPKMPETFRFGGNYHKLPRDIPGSSRYVEFLSKFVTVVPG